MLLSHAARPQRRKRMSERARRDRSADWRDSRQTGAMAAQPASRRTGEKALGKPAEPTGPGPAHARGVARRARARRPATR